MVAFLILQSFTKHGHSMTTGQCHSSDVHQQAIFPPVVPTGFDNIGVVSAEEYISNSRTPAREGERNSRPGIETDEK